MVRAALRLQAEGWRFAVVDLTSLGTPADATGYFQGLVKALARALRLRFDPVAFWAETTGETASQRLIRFFREIVLGGTEGPVAIFLDEIDSTLKLAYTDDLFTALRAIHNERTLDEGWRRLCFCLVGVATPNELIKDRRTTPYNVGRTSGSGTSTPRAMISAPLQPSCMKTRQSPGRSWHVSSTGPAATRSSPYASLRTSARPEHPRPMSPTVAWRTATPRSSTWARTRTSSPPPLRRGAPNR